MVEDITTNIKHTSVFICIVVPMKAWLHDGIRKFLYIKKDQSSKQPKLEVTMGAGRMRWLHVVYTWANHYNMDMIWSWSHGITKHQGVGGGLICASVVTTVGYFFLGHPPHKPNGWDMVASKGMFQHDAPPHTYPQEKRWALLRACIS